MLFVRPAELADVDALERMARRAHAGACISLPQRPARIEDARRACPMASFRAQVDIPSEESYLFVLEDRGAESCIGTAEIVGVGRLIGPVFRVPQRR